MTADAIGDEVPTIHTERLELVSMSVPFMEALAHADIAAAEREIDAMVPSWLVGQLENFVRYRLASLAKDPSTQPWLGRALVLTDEAGQRRVIGSAGFHAPPDAEGRVEIGYSVEPDYRLRGYAMEAVRALFDWAAERGVHRFVASISPDNVASLALTAQFGFRQVGEQIDEVDGLELVFETRWPPGGAPARSDGDGAS